MKKLFISVLIVMVILALTPQTAKAQFGKNMLMRGLNWQIYESPHFEIYFYVSSGENSTEGYVAKLHRWTETAYNQISQAIDYEMPINKKRGHSKPRIFVFRNRRAATHHPLGPGNAIAYAEPSQMRMICISDEYSDKKTQDIVTHETCHLFQFSLWNMAEKPPRFSRAWSQFLTFLFEGWSQHVSGLHKTEPNAQIFIRYWVLNGGLRAINIKDWPLRALSNSYPICYILAGYFYDYLEETYGKDVFKNFVTEFRRAKPTAKGFEKTVFQLLETDFAELDREFRGYLENQYMHLLIDKKEAFEYGRDILVQRRLLKPKKKVDAAYEPVISPSGDIVAAFITEKDNAYVALINAKDGTKLEKLTNGYSLYKYGLYPIVNLDGPGRALSYSRDGKQILYFAQTVGRDPVLVILEVARKKVKKIEIKLHDPQSPELSLDGKTVIFSAIKNGQRDIFSMNLETQEIKNLTNDKQFDYGPTFSPDEKTVVYVVDVYGYKKLFKLNTETLEKTQLTFGPSNEIRPIYSKDGKTIWFISDHDKNKTKNIYSLELENNKITQWTDVMNGVRTVMPIDDKRLLFGAIGYRDSRHMFSDNLYEMTLSKIEPIPVGNDLLDNQRVEIPEQEPVEININPENIKKYKPKFYLASAMFYGGADTRYGPYGMGHLYVTDLTNTKHIQANITQFGKWYTYNTLAFYDVSRRIGWGAVLSYENHFFYPWFVDLGYNPYGQPAMDIVLYNLRFKKPKLEIITQYPLDMCHRIEFSLSAVSAKYAHTDWRGEIELIEEEIKFYQQFPEEFSGYYVKQLRLAQDEYRLRADFLDKYINDGKFLTFNISFVRDTALFKQHVGPFANDAYRLDLSWSTGGHNTRISAESRKYFRWGSEWVFAMRGYAGAQIVGKKGTITPWIIGDLGELRGYEWMQFMGNRILLTNFELRFPLVKSFNLFGLYLGDVRVALFCDLARIEFCDKRFNVLNKDDINSTPTKGSIGVDVELLRSVPILGLPLHIAFSKRMTNVKFFPKFEEKWQAKLYLGYSF